MVSFLRFKNGFTTIKIFTLFLYLNFFKRYKPLFNIFNIKNLNLKVLYKILIFFKKYKVYLKSFKSSSNQLIEILILWRFYSLFYQKKKNFILFIFFFIRTKKIVFLKKFHKNDFFYKTGLHKFIIFRINNKIYKDIETTFPFGKVHRPAYGPKPILKKIEPDEEEKYWSKLLKREWRKHFFKKKDPLQKYYGVSFKFFHRQERRLKRQIYRNLFLCKSYKNVIITNVNTLNKNTFFKNKKILLKPKYFSLTLNKFLNHKKIKSYSFQYLRKNKVYNKGRYSRTRQNYRTGVYMCMYLSIVSIFGLYFKFYGYSFNFSHLWWLFILFISSFFLPKIIKYRLYNPYNIFLKIFGLINWLQNLIKSIF